MDILAAEATNLFVGTEAEPRQVVRIRVRGTEPRDARAPARVRVEGASVRSDEAALGPLGAGEEAVLEIGITVDGPVETGRTLPAEVVVEEGGEPVRHQFDVAVAEPGWRMFMVSHFHYDPVWWNTQAAYTETWGSAIRYRSTYQEPGLALVKSHLEMARRDADYKFVLAELDYLKPYWDVYPEDRAYIRQLFADGRLELMGGTYNEPNTNLTSAESTIRNAIYGVGYQRDVLGGNPATAWQLDAFGHDPQFPGIMADAGISSSSWARGPFHEWGPNWVRGPGRLPFAETASGEHPRMQFPMEFDWIAPSGRALLTSFMANHYSAGWWMDASTTLAEAEDQVHRLFTELATFAATKNVLLPVGTDYTPPNKWLTAIHRDWGRRYVWPKFIAALPSEFFAAVREAQAKTGRGFSPQTRDMNPIYTGKDVSFIDTKQAQRLAENAVLGAEKFATFAALLGARFPTEAIDKAWRQLLFGAHHDGITGSESDQVYLDLIAGWREALELGKSALDGALQFIGSRIDTAGEGTAVTVFNALSWPRTDIARVELDIPAATAGIELKDETGTGVPFVVEAANRRADGTIARALVAFLARDVPAMGHRTYRMGPGATRLDDTGWRPVETSTIENETYRVEIDPERGGTISSLVDKRTGKELVRSGEVANELRAYREYPNHPLFAEGPWHLTPDGRFTSATEFAAEVTAEESAIGRRLRVEGPFEASRRRQDIVLWDGIDRVELASRIEGYSEQDRLFRVRFGVSVEGGASVSEVGNAVVGRPFGFPNVDVAEVPFTLDHPAYNWFALGATVRVALVDGGTTSKDRASQAIGIAEVVAGDDAGQDDAVRALIVALVQQGVTSTLSRHDGHRYGVLQIDSNLPDTRVAIGGPSTNRFVAELLDSAGAAYRTELERQLADRGWARVWVPALRPRGERSEPIPDLRGVRDLPVLVVAGRDAAATIGAIQSLAEDLADSVITVEQPQALDGPIGSLEDYTVAVLNRGLPGFNVEPDGNLYLSLMRSCSGWPSGVWIDPPRRAVPDGSNFQFQHWSHSFEYAIVGGAGDWRTGGIVEAGHEYNNPLLARSFEAHPGELAATTSLIQVEPASVVCTAVKPAGNPLARMAAPDLDPTAGIVLRLYESAGRPTDAEIRCSWPLVDLEVTGATEESSRSVRSEGGKAVVHLEPFEIVTVRARPTVATRPEGSDEGEDLAPRGEAAQPVFSGYWLHNKGAAPMGYQPVTVQVRPWLLRGNGPFTLPIVVSSERTDDPVEGSVAVIVPSGWQASPSDHGYRLKPGAHEEFESTVVPAGGATSGRYFVAARITDDSGQTHEDVVTIDLGSETDGASAGPGDGSRTLARSIERAIRTAGIGSAPDPSAGWFDGLADDVEVGGELVAELETSDVRLKAGDSAEVRVKISNRAASEVRGEAQVISPHETWPAITPWTQGFVVGPGEDTVVTFAVSPPYDFSGGTYWALVKVMYFGRLLYTDTIPIEVMAATSGVPASAAGRKRRI
jgi:alpha-mannosidase